jgi:hypothetical protein
MWSRKYQTFFFFFFFGGKGAECSYALLCVVLLCCHARNPVRTEDSPMAPGYGPWTCNLLATVYPLNRPPCGGCRHCPLFAYGASVRMHSSSQIWEMSYWCLLPFHIVNTHLTYSHLLSPRHVWLPFIFIAKCKYVFIL